MSTSDIYGVKDESGPVMPPSRRRRRSSKLSDKQDVSKTNTRRTRNTGLRRFMHLMKKPEYSRKIWIGVLSVVGLILLLLIIWDWFFRYKDENTVSVQAPCAVWIG